MELTILEQETLIKEFLSEINKFVGREILFATYNPKNKLIDKGFSKSEMERFINFLIDKKLIEVEVKMGRYGSRFRVPKFIDYSNVIDWRTQSTPGRTKSNAKIEVKEKPKLKITNDKINPKEYKVGQSIYFMNENKLWEGKLISIELAKSSYNKSFEELKNSDFEYTILTEAENKFCLLVYEFSDSIDGLFSLLKSRFNNQNK